LQLAQEPSNYPTNFKISNIKSDTIYFSWDEAEAGTQAPSGYLLLVRNYVQNLKPSDGGIFSEDINISDGNGALNLSAQTLTAYFIGLDTNKSYNFYIYSFNGDSLQRNYKTDGNPPIAKYIGKSSQQTLFAEDFEGTSHLFNSISLASNKNWTVGTTGGGAESTSKYIYINGYGGDAASDDWLISPSIDLTNKQNIILEFYIWYRYTGPDLTLKASTNYNGGNPSQAVWQTISFTKPSTQQSWTKSTIDLNSFAGSPNFRIAFHYTSTGTASVQAALWQVDQVKLTAEQSQVVIQKPTVPSSNFTLKEIKNTSISFKWTKGNGTNRLVVASEEIPISFLPEDGIYYSGDLRFAYGEKLGDSIYAIYNGSGDSLKISNLNPGKKYYFAIFEYNGAAENIKYLTEQFLVGEAITTNLAEPLLIVKWDFEDGNLFSDYGNINNQNKRVIKSPSLTDPSTGAFPSGNPGKAYSQANWSNGQFIGFQINSQGMANLRVEFDTRSSSSGPKNFALAYSLDSLASNLIEISGASFISPSSFGSNPMFSFDLPAVCSGAKELTIALLCKENPSNENGTFRVDNFAVYGEPLTNLNENYFERKKAYLFQNYPNPFNSQTTIKFYLPEEGLASIIIFDALGKKIFEIENQFFKMGYNNINLDFSNLSSGVYLYILKYNQTIFYKKLIFVK